jgi:D-alanine-D-alanine ligase
MKSRAVLLLYGLDEQTLPLDAEVTRQTIQRAEQVLRSYGWQVASRQVVDDWGAALEPFPPDQWVVFNLCEGEPFQPFYYAHAAQELERRGYAYTGSEASVLHETQFKPKLKQMLEAHSVPTPRWTAVERAEDLEFDLFPAIVKPAAEHCSFGITRQSVVLNLEQARAQAAAVVARYAGGALIEEFLDSEEFGVAVWGDDDELEVLGISMITYAAFPDMHDRLCTFEAKWLTDTEAYKKTMPICPVPVTAELKAQLEALACAAHRACGARDYSRVDMRMRADQPMVLDVNANCALSENAGFPDTGRIVGWDYGALLDRLARMALARNGRLAERAGNEVCG